MERYGVKPIVQDSGTRIDAIAGFVPMRDIGEGRSNVIHAIPRCGKYEVVDRDVKYGVVFAHQIIIVGLFLMNKIKRIVCVVPEKLAQGIA